MANAAEMPYTANTTVSEPLELEEDTTISVASGKTVVYDANAVISGGYALTKTGAGKLILAGANTFTEGVTISEGSLMASNSLALGTGDVTILGQRDGYTGICRLELAGAGKNETFTNTFANNIHVTGTSYIDYPVLIVYGQNAVLSGNVVADADFAYYEDLNSTKAISSSQYNRYMYVLSLTFKGNINVAGTMLADGWTRFAYTGTVTAGAFNHGDQARIQSSSLKNAKHDFSGPVTIAGDFVNTKHMFTFDGGLTVGGAMRWNGLNQTSYYGYTYLGSGCSVVSGAMDNDPDLSITRYTSKDAWTVNMQSTGRLPQTPFRICGSTTICR